MSMGETSFTRATKFTACSLRLFFSGENVVHRLSEKYSADYLIRTESVCACVLKETWSCIVPVAFLSRVTACEWLMPSAEVPQILTIRSPIWGSERERIVQFKKVYVRKNDFL